MCVCVYVYIYTYIYTHTYVHNTYIHTYVHTHISCHLITTRIIVLILPTPSERHLQPWALLLRIKGSLGLLGPLS